MQELSDKAKYYSESTEHMELHEKIRLARELNKWSQEEVAEKLEMSPSGYAKIERGETALNIPRLEQIAEIFNIDIWELVKAGGNGLALQINSENHNGGGISIYNATDAAALEIEKLKLQLAHKNELLAQKERENAILRELADSLKAQLNATKQAT